VRTSKLIGLVILIVLAVSLGSVWLYPSSRDFMTSNNTWNGLKDFSRQSGLINLDSLNGLEGSTGKKTLICIPYLEYKTADLEQIKQFVNRGGTLLLMDDFGYGNTVLDYLGSSTRFDGKMLLDPLFCYKNPSLPYITDFSPELKESGLTALAFNHATVLRPGAGSQVLAWSSPASCLDTGQNGGNDSTGPSGPFPVPSGYDSQGPSGPFPVAARFMLGQGKVMLVSDPSLIINAMAAQNDNFAFIRRLASDGGQMEGLVLDRAHLDKSPLDVSRSGLDAFRRVFSRTYLLLGLIAVIFALVIGYTFRKGEIFGKE
jgi:hypothetical protein